MVAKPFEGVFKPWFVSAVNPFMIGCNLSFGKAKVARSWSSIVAAEVMETVGGIGD